MSETTVPERTGQKDYPTGTWELADLVHDTRKAKGMSQKELAERVGRSRGYINAIEDARRAIYSHDVAVKLAEALDLTTDELYAANKRIPPDIEDTIRSMDPSGFKVVRSVLAEIGKEG